MKKKKLGEKIHYYHYYYSMLYNILQISIKNIISLLQAISEHHPKKPILCISLHNNGIDPESSMHILY